MMADDAPQRARRAGRGRTFDPYGCCGKEPANWSGRKKDAPVCGDCLKLIEDGKAARERAEKEKSAGTMEPTNFYERGYALPGYYFEGCSNIDTDTLKRAMFDLVQAVSLPAPPGTQKYRTDTGKDDHRNPWPGVIEDTSRASDWRILILMNPMVRDAVMKLDAAVRTLLPAAYQSGKRDGANVLLGLATGDVSMNDFDTALMTPEERGAAEKARRGY